MWMIPCEEMNPLCPGPTVKHGGDSVRVRASMGWNGLATLDFIDDKMTNEVYLTVLNNNQLKSATKIMLRKKFVFLEDSNTKHTYTGTGTIRPSTDQFQFFDNPVNSVDLKPCSFGDIFVSH